MPPERDRFSSTLTRQPERALALILRLTHALGHRAIAHQSQTNWR
jgi:hypothetical protein